ncbi:MAG: hypothetical protein JKY56_23710 [Kofleriaceae bacterium]|nr:hypothetical protein [Kofleriaceae bacterium]
MQVTDTQFKALVIFVVVVVVGVVTRVRFYGDFEFPREPRRPTVHVGDLLDVSEKIEGSTDAYELHLQEDSVTFGVGRVTLREMSEEFLYQTDRERRVLEVGEGVRILDLKLTLKKETPKSAYNAQMMLTIENRSKIPVAYKITTSLSSGDLACTNMVHVAHNGIAILPGASTTRSECSYKKDRTLIISKVETVQLPTLGYYYLSSIRASEMLGTRRLKGHKAPLRSMACDGLQSTRQKIAIERGDILWRDIVDFYARHRCNTYSFFEGYKAFQGDGEEKLPALSSDP